MYSVQTSNGDTGMDEFLIKIGLHQGSAYFFPLVMDEVARDIQGDIP